MWELDGRPQQTWTYTRSAAHELYLRLQMERKDIIKLAVYELVKIIP